MAATVPVEKAGASSPLLDQANQVGEFSKAVAAATAQATSSTTQAEPRTGSFEAFMGSFGAPRRWAR